MKKQSLLAGAGLIVLAVLTAWSQPLGDTAHPVDQGWSAGQKNTWYTLSQGSRLVPLAWIRALEVHDGTALFLGAANVEKFRYLPTSADGSTLPIGFAVDVQSDTRFSEITKLRWKQSQSDREPWVGMNCAACHTGEITFQAKRLRIEGAPAISDFQNFIRAFNLALVATRDDTAKWERFASRVLRGEDTSHNRELLRTELSKLVKWQMRVEQANETPLDYGFARVDAFGHIFNKILLRVGAADQPRNPSDAPVSYPFLWNIHQHDKVQWNGIAPNVPIGDATDIGALSRNVGEVTGVFADLTLLPFGPAIQGYPNSAQVKNLLALERQLTTLKPPVWPSALPAIDPEKWEAGKALFEKPGSGCTSCHQVLARDDLKTSFKARMTRLSGPQAIGTDPWMACNSYTYRAKSGALEFTPDKFFIFSGPPLPETAPVADLLSTAVIGSIWYNRSAVVGDLKQALLQNKSFQLEKATPAVVEAAASIFMTPGPVPVKDSRLKRCMAEQSETLAYKGRPLNGIWATPPYMHNGSVPSLYDVLLPPSQRPASFSLGTREFDPERVGYANEYSNPLYATERAKHENTFVFRTRDAASRPIAGNWNAGHDYGNALLTEADRWALVEYMKAVGGRRVGNSIVP